MRVDSTGLTSTSDQLTLPVDLTLTGLCNGETRSRWAVLPQVMFPVQRMQQAGVIGRVRGSEQSCSWAFCYSVSVTGRVLRLLELDQSSAHGCLR